MRVANTLIIIGIVTSNLNLFFCIAKSSHDSSCLLDVALKMRRLPNLIIRCCRLLLDLFPLFLFFFFLLNFLFFLFSVFLIYVQIVGCIGTCRSVDFLDALLNSLVILVEVYVVVGFVDHNKGRDRLHCGERLEYKFGYTAIVLLMAFARKDEILLIFCVFGKQLAYQMGHRIVLDQLGLEDILVGFVGFEIWVVHVAATDH